MKEYSKDLREKIIIAIEAEEETQGEIAERFGVSLSFLEKLKYKWKTTGNYEALPRGGNNPRTLKGEEKLIRELVAQQPDATLAELCEQVAKKKGKRASPSQMCRELQILKLPIKKKRSTIAKGTQKE